MRWEFARNVGTTDDPVRISIRGLVGCVCDSGQRGARREEGSGGRVWGIARGREASEQACPCLQRRLPKQVQAPSLRRHGATGHG